MGLIKFLSVALAFGTFSLMGAVTSPFADGHCNYDPGPGGLLKAVCFFPACPSGGDCTPPAVQVGSAKIEYFEPLVQWKETCPSTSITGGCWEVYMDFKLRLAASDPAGVNAVGVNIAQDLDGRRILKKYFANAVKKDSEGKYEINGGMVAHVPGGRPLQLSVYELCARDGLGNEGCSTPLSAADSERLATKATGLP